MPSTTNKIYEVPTHGTQVDTWDVPLNSNFNIIDKNFGGVLSKALTNVPVTLSASEQQNGIIRFTGTLTGNVAVTFSALGSYFMIDNRTTGAFTVTLTTGAGEVIGVPQGEATQVFVDGSNVRFVSLDRIGAYWDYAGSSVPTWVTSCTVPPYLICDGTAFSAVTYPYLNTVLGGTTLPDLRGRSRAYLNGGTSRLTTAGSGVDGDTRFAAGGAQNFTIAQANLPSVNFTVSGITLSDPGHAHSFPTNGTIARGGSDKCADSTIQTGSDNTTTNTTGITIANQGQAASGGSSTALGNVQPTCIGGITMIRAA